jgi:DNA-binding response OmpR family regulator
MLPGMDGLEVLKKIRGNSRTAEVPVIMLTVVDDFKTKLKGFYIGADDYLVKPIKSLELLARVKSNLRKYRGINILKGSLTGKHASNFLK